MHPVPPGSSAFHQGTQGTVSQLLEGLTSPWTQNSYVSTPQESKLYNNAKRKLVSRFIQNFLKRYKGGSKFNKFKAFPKSICISWVVFWSLRWINRHKAPGREPHTYLVLIKSQLLLSKFPSFFNIHILQPFFVNIQFQRRKKVCNHLHYKVVHSCKKYF